MRILGVWAAPRRRWLLAVGKGWDGERCPSRFPPGTRNFEVGRGRGRTAHLVEGSVVLHGAPLHADAQIQLVPGQGVSSPHESGAETVIAIEGAVADEQLIRPPLVLSEGGIGALWQGGSAESATRRGAAEPQ